MAASGSGAYAHGSAWKRGSGGGRGRRPWRASRVGGQRRLTPHKSGIHASSSDSFPQKYALMDARARWRVRVRQDITAGHARWGMHRTHRRPGSAPRRASSGGRAGRPQLHQPRVRRMPSAGACAGWALRAIRPSDWVLLAFASCAPPFVVPLDSGRKTPGGCCAAATREGQGETGACQPQVPLRR
jgi:hypothetical protein